MFCTLHLNRVAYKKVPNYRSGLFLLLLNWELRAGIFASAEHKAFQVTSVPKDLQSMSVLLVCAVMPHLEYKHDSCLKRKAQLVCLLAHSVSFLALTFLPRVKIFFFFFFFFPLLVPPAVCCGFDRCVCASPLNDPIFLAALLTHVLFMHTQVNKHMYRGMNGYI